MSKQECINYSRIAEAIEYIQQNFTEQPTLEEIAEKVHLSPFHFQRMKKENRVFFKTVKQEETQGFRSCGHCLRAAYKIWKNGLI